MTWTVYSSLRESILNGALPPGESLSQVQLATKLGEAPLAYLLSAFAAVVYVVATVSLARSTPGSRRVAWVAVLVELVGVLTVGTLTLVDAADFPEATVWSGFGSGYGYVPLVLPLLGIAWLRWTGRRTTLGG